jgi:hypothetical protein
MGVVCAVGRVQLPQPAGDLIERGTRREVGRAAAELLVDEADRPAEHEHRRIVFTPELVVRASSGPDPEALKATSGWPAARP